MDVNSLNSIYNHILLMVSSHSNPSFDSKNIQLAKMSRQIEQIIRENILLKEEIDAKHTNMIDLQQIAEHLHTNPAELVKNGLAGFI